MPVSVHRALQQVGHFRTRLHAHDDFHEHFRFFLGGVRGGFDRTEGCVELRLLQRLRHVTPNRRRMRFAAM